MPAPAPATPRARAAAPLSRARASDLSSPQSVARIAQSYGPLASRTPYRLSLPGQEPAIPEAAEEEAPAEAPPHAPFGASIFKRDHGAAVPVPPSHAAVPPAASSSAPAAALNRSSSNSSAGTPSKRTQRMSVKDRMALFQGPR